MTQTMNIAVIGAGIAGLASALALRARGHDVQVFEQAAALTEVGAGLQISPNGMAVLNGLGLQDEIKNLAQPIQYIQLIDGWTDKPVVRMPLPGHGHGYGAFHRADLVGMLFAAGQKAGIGFEFGASVSADDMEWADLVIGADGLHSPTRARLNGGADPQYTGYVAWRALVPASQVAQPFAQIAMGPGRHVVSYPVRGGALINIVAVEERKDWAIESWSAIGDPAQMRAVFADFGPATQRLLGAVTSCNEWGLFRHPIARKWHDGARIALIGDAAHPTLPFMAQGANLALEDAWVLADCLSCAGAAAGLADYQAARLARVTRALNVAQAVAKRYHLSHPVVRGVAHLGLSVLGRVAPNFLPSRFDWLYGHDVTKSG